MHSSSFPAFFPLPSFSVSVLLVRPGLNPNSIAVAISPSSSSVVVLRLVPVSQR